MSVYAHPPVLIRGPEIVVGRKELPPDERANRERERKRLNNRTYREAQRAMREASGVTLTAADRRWNTLPRREWPRPADRAQRKVDPNGKISFANAIYSVGRDWTGCLVEVFRVEERLYVALNGPILRVHPVTCRNPAGPAPGRRLWRECRSRSRQCVRRRLGLPRRSTQDSG